MRTTCSCTQVYLQYCMMQQTTPRDLSLLTELALTAVKFHLVALLSDLTSRGTSRRESSYCAVRQPVIVVSRSLCAHSQTKVNHRAIMHDNPHTRTSRPTVCISTKDHGCRCPLSYVSRTRLAGQQDRSHTLLHSCTCWTEQTDTTLPSRGWKARLL